MVGGNGGASHLSIHYVFNFFNYTPLVSELETFNISSYILCIKNMCVLLPPCLTESVLYSKVHVKELRVGHNKL